MGVRSERADQVCITPRLFISFVTVNHFPVRLCFGLWWSFMRVIMFPGRGNVGENRFIDILVDALRAHDVTVEPWFKEWSYQTGDIFHVHWPEAIGNIRARRYQRLRGALIGWQFRRTIRRIKASGGKIIWTAHDILPHLGSDLPD